jgi:hypothetical protein
VFDITNCVVTLNMVVVALGLLGLCILWSQYKIALLIVYVSSVYWAYTLYQTDLLQMMGQDAFYWSGALALGLGSILLVIIDQMQSGH